MDGSERFTAKREAGMSAIRRDGSQYAADVDRDAFAAERWAAVQLGGVASEDVYATHGDDGYDFEVNGVKWDAYWIKHPRGQYIIENTYRKNWPDRFVVVGGEPGTFRLLGWCDTYVLKSGPLKDFGFGPKHAMHVSALQAF